VIERMSCQSSRVEVCPHCQDSASRIVAMDGTCWSCPTKLLWGPNDAAQAVPPSLAAPCLIGLQTAEESGQSKRRVFPRLPIDREARHALSQAFDHLELMSGNWQKTTSSWVHMYAVINRFFIVKQAHQTGRSSIGEADGDFNVTFPPWATNVATS
jgi:hypothetical protein